MLISITPKRYIHNILAHHIDEKGCLIHKQHDKKGTSVSLAGFNCQVDDLVVASGFVHPNYQIQLNPPFLHQTMVVAGEKKTSFALYFINNLRGPPCI